MWPGWLVSGALPLSAHPAYQEWGHGCRPGGKLPLGQHSASLSGLLLSVLSTSLTSPHSSLAGSARKLTTPRKPPCQYFRFYKGNLEKLSPGESAEAQTTPQLQLYPLGQE